MPKPRYPSTVECPICKRLTSTCLTKGGDYSCQNVQCGDVLFGEERIKDLVEQHFLTQGPVPPFQRTARSTASGGGYDLKFENTHLGLSWIIEAKSHTPNSNDAINLQTGLGQLLQHWKPPSTGVREFYGLAMPLLTGYPGYTFVNESWRLHPTIRRDLRLHWLWIPLTGPVQCDHPVKNCPCGLP